MSIRRHPVVRRVATVLALALAAAGASAHDASTALSGASALSIAVPIGASVVAPAALLSGAAALTVVSVQASAAGTVWVLERASDGARFSVTWASEAAGTASVVAGTVVAVTVLSTGWVLSQAGRAIAFIPNEVGASLTYRERMTEVEARGADGRIR